LLGVRILCEADYEQHLRQFGDQLQQLHQSVSAPAQPPPPPDADTMASPSMSDASAWYGDPGGRHQPVPAGRRLRSSPAENRRSLDDRSSGYGSPSPPCV